MQSTKSETALALNEENDDAASQLLSTMKGDKKKEKKSFGNVTIERTDGEKIIIPDGMTYAEARLWLERIEKGEETVVAFRSEMKAFPWDGAYALFRAMSEKFGYAAAIAKKDPSGGTPPTMVSLKLPDGKYVSVPWGRMQFPGLDDKSYLEMGYDNATMKFIVHGQIKKKFQPSVDQLMALTERILKTDSLYKGHAIIVDLAFLDTPGMQISQPEFLDNAISNIQDEDVLMNDVTRINYSAVLLRIEKTEECKKKGIPLKHGCLLAGPYGTGKTLLAKYTAKISIENGWTFIYLEKATQMKNALRLAELYSPCVVFSEDIDKAVEGNSRTLDINQILNTLDGIDTKTNPIITILTTNHLENINKAFLRAGRIDSLIQMTPLDANTGAKFLDRFAKDSSGVSLLAPGKDYTRAAAGLTGIVPAFAYEVINKAKMYAMYNDRDLLEPEDIETASESFKEHIKLTTENVQLTPEQELAKSVERVNNWKNPVETSTLQEMEAKINSIDEYIKG